MRLVRQAAILAVLATGCSGKPEMRTVTPERLMFAGDTELFGENAVVAVDAMGRYIALEARRPARLFVYAVSPKSNSITNIAECWVEPGRHRIEPTLSMVVQGRNARRPVTTYSAVDGLLLVILIAEEPREAKRECVSSGTGRYISPMDAQTALNRQALDLRRYPDSPWAAYLVEP